MKNTSFVITFDIFPFDIFFSIDKKFETLEKKLKEIVPEELHHEIIELKDTSEARTFKFSGGQICVWFRTLNDGLICHEAVHAAEMLLKENLNIEHNANTSELYAYTIQYIFVTMQNSLK